VDPAGRVSDLDDNQLVAQWRAGSHDAFAALVDRHKDKIYWLVRRIAGVEEAEDLTQEVFLRAYQALPQFRGEASLKTWLCRIAYNLSATRLGKRRRQPEEQLLDEVEAPPSIADLEGEVEQREFAGIVHACVDRLPEHFRTALTLYYLNEIRYEEIAEITGLPLGTVKAHIHRGRLRLKELVLAAINSEGVATK
jgi:RNA polymerase sigma-70 factor, ECF subfamily